MPTSKRMPRVVGRGAAIFFPGRNRSKNTNPMVITPEMERLQKRGEEFCTPILSKFDVRL